MSYETERERPGREPVTIMELYPPRCQLDFGKTNSAGTCSASLTSETDTYDTTTDADWSEGTLDGVEVDGGLRLEAHAAENLLTYSEQFDAAAWVKQGASIAADVIYGPDGSLTADKLVEDTSTGLHRVMRTDPGTDNIQQCFTIYLKAAERTAAQLFIFDNDETTSYVAAQFDLLSGTVRTSWSIGNAGPVSADMIELADGWFRCAVSGVPNTLGTGGSVFPQVRIYDTAVGAGHTGDGSSGLYIFGAQLEPGDTPGPYLRTEATAGPGVVYSSDGISSATGTRTETLALSGRYASSTISWTATEPAGTSVTVEVSKDGGETWEECTNGAELPGFSEHEVLGDVLLRQTLTTDDPSETPVLESLSVEVETYASQKCFNTLATCQATDDYTAETVTYRWSTAQQAIPPSFRVRPTIVDVDYAPRRLAPSKGLGEGAECRVTVLDHPWHDVWEDPYRDERGYDPMEQGTYWPKWLARNPYYRGIRMRLLTGYISPDGFSLDDFTAREYVLDSVKGPDSSERATLVGTDVFKMLEKDRAVVPSPNTGVLDAGIDESATSFTLSPTGIGDEEYPSEFRCVIGKEGFDVTRSGDTCTITERGLYRGLDEHEAGDAVQVVRQFSAERVDDIAYDLITEARPELADYIPTTEWAQEAEDYLPELYSADIIEPTGVNTLLAELMESAPVLFWPNEKERRIEMQAIKPPPVGVTTLNDTEHFLSRRGKSTLQKEDRPKDRIDAVLVRFGLLDPTDDKDKASNYAQSYYYVVDNHYDTSQIREVHSRWINRYGLAHAEALAKSYVGRFRETPVTLKFQLDAKHGDHWTGDVFSADTRRLQDEFGANAPRTFQIIEAFEKEPGHLIEYEAESYDWWVEEDDTTGERTVYYSDDSYNEEIRTAYDTQYSVVNDAVRCIIRAGVTIGSES